MITLALFCGVAGPVSAARIVCWTNSDGVRECGNSVPPEYAQKSTERKSAQGITVERTKRAKTPEELAAMREERERRDREEAERKRIEKEQAQYDRVLLATFTTEQDLELTRDGKIAALDSRIKHSEHIGAKLAASLETMQKEAAKMERGGKVVSEELQARIDVAREQLNENMADIGKRQQEKQRLHEQFAKDLARYRELKGIKPSN
jgi:hypothetical protein